MLTIQARSADKLQAMLTTPQFARIHMQLPEGFDSQIPDQQLYYQELPLSGKPFEIVIKQGIIRDLLVDKNVPTWELNLLKGIVSQLQIVVQGENALNDHNTQQPRDGQYFISYKVIEDTVGGECEVLYDISPLSADNLYNSPELAPLMNDNHNKDKFLIDIRKTKNYNNCKQQRSYYFGLGDSMSLTQRSNKDRLTTKSSDSRIVISGDLKRFTIQSSVTTNNIFVKSENSINSFIGTVYSKINLTLENMNKISKKLSINSNLLSTGNLLYTYNNPLTEIEQGKQQETVSRNSQHIQSSERSSSSSEQNQSQGRSWRKQSDGSNRSNSNLQLLISLNEAPKSTTPLSLAFQDNQESLNFVEEAQKQPREIVDKLQQSNTMENLDTLEMFINFVNLLRDMNDTQIAEVEQGVLSNVPHNLQSSENTFVENDVWSILRDGVAQAGTGPALLTIIKWIQKGKLDGIEAARVISKIPKVVRIPSENYIKAVFNNLVADQKVQQQEFVNKIAPIAFSELVRNVQVDKRHSQNAYPVYNFGKLNPESDKDVTENYIPFMEKQLEKCIQNGDNALAQAYIVALGNFGHSKVLGVFEPFLEGRQNVSTYLRTLMVSSLRSLVRRSPAVVAPVLYKIYLNDEESHEVRCAAVHLYMLTNPPLVSMLRMAKYTNFDKSNEVNAAVKSSIISLSKVDRPEFDSVSLKAHYVRRFLTPKKFSKTNSRDIFTKTTIVQTTGSDDYSVPKNVYINMQNAFGNIAKSIIEAEYGVSSVKRLIDIFEKPEAHQEGAWLNNIRQSLGMQAKIAEQLEGNVRISTIFGTDFYPFDQQSIEKFALYIKKNLEKDQRVHINRMDSYEESISFPTESGLPFTYNIEMPMLTRIHMNKRNEQGDKPNNKSTNGIINVLVANKVQTRFGVVVSHVHQHCIAGVDRNSLVHIPIEYNINVESEKPSQIYELKMHVDPKVQSSPLRLAHHNVVPFTAQLRMIELQPAIRNGMIPVRNSKEQKKSLVRVGDINIISESDNIQVEPNLKSIFKRWFSFFDNSILHYRNIEVFSLNHLGIHGKDETIVTVAYDESETQGDNNEKHKNGSRPSWEIQDSHTELYDNLSNSVIRRRHLLKEVSKGMKSVKAYVYDVSAEIPWLDSRQVLTISVGHSNVERRSQFIIFWNSQSETGEVIHETQITGMVQSTQNDFLNYDKAAHQLPQDDFTMNMHVRKNHKKANKIQLKGRLLRSDRLTKTMMKSKTVQQCVNEMQLGRRLQACQKAIDLALKKNLLQMSINMDSDDHNEIANMILGYFSEIIPNANIELANSRNSDLKNKINVEVKMSPSFENAQTTLETSQINLKFQLHDSSEDKLWQQNENEGFENEEKEASCILSKNEIVTFDQKSYPLHMGGIWHVLMIPDHLQILKHPDIQPPLSKIMKVNVMAREINNRLQVRVLLGEREYRLQQLGDRLQVLINGQEVKLSKQKSHQDKEKRKTVAELFIQPDDSLTLNSKNHGINILYDGKRVRLQVTKSYRNAVRGLCGNYDKQANNDFLIPQNCILQKPEEFSATFALLDNETEDSDVHKIIAKNRKKANRASCTLSTPRQTNVINDREVGRELEKQTWGYHQNSNQNKKNQGNARFVYRTKVDESD
nr:PREDICTED: vitellogenin-1-like [Linepithema humile]